MTAVVADASALVEYLLRTELGDQVATVIEEPDVDLHVPDLADLEVCAALRRLTASGSIDEQRAIEALVLYESLPLRRHITAIDRLLALDPGVSAYDGAYVTLCEELGATLVTCDDRLTKTTRERVDLNVIGVSEPRA